MIQAPQMQYMPAQMVPQQTYPQQGAYTPVQYTQTPGVFYNYPTASCYAQPVEKPQYNGVNIEIVNPQGQALAPQGCYQMPAQFVPVQQPVVMPQPYVAPFPVAQAINQAPQQVMPQPVMPQVQQPAMSQVQQPVMPQVQQPAPQYVAPQPVQVQPVQVQQPAPQIPAPQIVATPQPVQPQITPVVEQPAAPENPAIPESFAGRLKTDDIAAQRTAIEDIAETVKNKQDEGKALIDTIVFDALMDVVNKDTSNLQGPSPDVLALREKDAQKRTPQETEMAETLAPLEEAIVNKKYALYTIAFMQERLNNEVAAVKGQALELKDVPCIEQVIDIVKSNPNAELRQAGISALSRIARPEYKADLNTIFELAKADADPNVRDAATDAISKLNK